MYSTAAGGRRAALLLVFLLAALAGFHWSIKDFPDVDEIAEFRAGFTSATARIGNPATDFDLTLTTGETFALRDHIGRRVVVLNFFATWCPPCIAEMPELDRFARENAGEDFILIGVDMDERPGIVDKFLRENDVGFPVGIDEGAIGRAYGAGKLPTTVLIGVDGAIKLFEVGAIANADVALGGLLMEGRAAIAAGDTASAWRPMTEVVATERNTPAVPSLGGRAAEIAGAMRCPCGCDDDFVADCSCGTADAIRERLLVMKFGERSDSEIIRELNREFCGGGM